MGYKDKEPEYELNGVALTERQRLIVASKCFKNVAEQFNNISDLLSNATDALYLTERIDKVGITGLTREETLKFLRIGNNLDSIIYAPDQIESALNNAVKAMELIRTLYDM